MKSKTDRLESETESKTEVKTEYRTEYRPEATTVSKIESKIVSTITSETEYTPDTDAALPTDVEAHSYAKPADDNANVADEKKSPDDASQPTTRRLKMRSMRWPTPRQQVTRRLPMLPNRQ